ncbi:MAG TPA: hypothetical protein VH350_09530 [Candidatus Sulfotelmatobacter sp.]|nr:hypothetical protein [Candidatus Sulfotelmatobacter sp.]
MKKIHIVVTAIALALSVLPVSPKLRAQDSAVKSADPAPTADQDSKSGPSYSGMYSFQKEGEFIQVSVEDAGHVTGFISRFGDGENDKGAFLDQFFKTGKLAGNKLTFTTEIVHGTAFDFKGTVERGEGKNPADEAYFVLKGTLTENTTDVNKKLTSHSREVTFKKFPQDASPAPQVRK